MRWYTQAQYVDLHSGETLTKYESELNYIIKKKKYETRIERKLNTKTRILEPIGIRTIIYECERAGKQLRIW